MTTSTNTRDDERERLLRLVAQLTETHAVWRRIAEEDRAAGVETTARSAQVRADVYAEVVHRLCAALELEPPAEVAYPYPRSVDPGRPHGRDE